MDSSPILPLDQSVIRQISAGEVINKPYNVVKELLENAIDAHATRIIVQIENGGYGLIRVMDDGCGFRVEDLPIAARRHTTSKIKRFDDLMRVQTFGFRGEALFSMSVCSHLTIVTRRRTDEHGYQCQYQDGEMCSPITPIAANFGSIIDARDLFYNDPVRLEGRQSTAIELRLIDDVITKYAIVNPEISFTFKSGLTEMTKTPGDSTFDYVIRNIYKLTDEHAFFELNFEPSNDTKVKLFLNQPTTVKIPKSKSAVFINGRLTKSPKIHKSISSAYQDYAIRGVKPFFFAQIWLPQERVDVNYHAAKEEIRILIGEDEVITAIHDKVKEALQSGADHRPIVMAPIKGSSQHRSSKKLIEGQQLISQFVNTPGNERVSAEPVEMEIEEPIDQKVAENEDQNEVIRPSNQEPEVIRPNREEPESEVMQPNNDQIEDIRPNREEDNDHIEVNRPNNEKPKSEINKSKSEVKGDHSVKTKYIESDDDQPIPDDQSEEEIPLKKVTVPSETKKKYPKPESKRNQPFNKLAMFDELRFKPKNQLPPNMRTLEQVLSSQPTVIPRRFRTVNLASILTMRDEVEKSASTSLHFFEESQFIGIVGLRVALLVHDNTLFGINLFGLTREWAYQRLLSSFMNYNSYRLPKPIDIKGCASLSPFVSNPVQVAEIFAENSLMLDDYFSISVKDGMLYSMPQMISGYQPTLTAMSLFFAKVAEVDWSDEYSCLNGILKELSSLYAVYPEDDENEQIRIQLSHELNTVVFPDIRDMKSFVPSEEFMKSDAIEAIGPLSMLS